MIAFVARVAHERFIIVARLKTRLAQLALRTLPAYTSNYTAVVVAVEPSDW